MIKCALILMVCLFGFSLQAANQLLTDDQLSQIRFDQKVGAQVSGALVFKDETGRPVRLGDYFDGKPQVLILGYYGCPMLCTLVLNGATESFRDMTWQPGNQFNVIFVSIDPNETPALAAAKQDSYRHAYGNVHAESWHFLTGDAASISNLTCEVGFRYAYDIASRQFAHPSGFVVLTPGGKVSRYFSGVNFAAKEVDNALRAAAANKTGDSQADFTLLCFHYAPIHGKYGNLVMAIVRISGLVMLAVVLILILTQANRVKAGGVK